jgi:hypothetical protein
MEYLDEKIVDGFRVEMQQQLGEAIRFAVEYLRNRDEHDELELRQAAQDALQELMPSMVDATAEAYRRSTLKAPDFEAVTLLFKNLAIRAKLLELCARSPDHPDQFPTVTLVTRKGEVTGTLYDMLKREGQEQIHLSAEDNGETWIPLVSVQDLRA